MDQPKRRKTDKCCKAKQEVCTKEKFESRKEAFNEAMSKFYTGLNDLVYYCVECDAYHCDCLKCEFNPYK